MSRHKHNELPKSSKLDLEHLRESRETADKAKAEMLEHNHVLHLHAEPEMQAEEEPVEKPAASSYIKQPEDQERIAKNTSRGEAPIARLKTADMLQSYAGQIFALQCETIATCLETWSDMMGKISAASRPSMREPAE
jgi:hypothetical protein